MTRNRRPSGAPGSTGGQFAPDVRAQTDLDLRGPSSTWSEENILANVDYWMTDAGHAELVTLVAEAKAAADASRTGVPEGGGRASDHLKWWNSAVRKEASDAEGTLRSIEKARAEDTLAADIRASVFPETVTSALTTEAQRPPTRQSVEDSNGNWNTATVIGSVVVTEPFEGTQHYETAAWYTKHQIQPGTYEVRLDDRGMVRVGYDTVITDEFFPTLLGGVPLRGGQPDAKPNVGKAGSHHVSAYEFSLPGAYAPGLPQFGGALVLRRGVTVQRQPRTGVSGLLFLTKLKLPADVEVLPNIENEFRRRWYGR